MEAAIVHFRQGPKSQTTNQMVLLPKDAKNRESAEKHVGKTVKWYSPAKKEIKGTITRAHGNSGAVVARFETGMPGQSIGTKVKLE